ncbi:laccase, multicopper oxidase, benzenediol:oxygen oxidorectuctase [Stygiomarasmius scandens]|uniref:Laccase, multicopper oxidase, benzenediol:oxygen oxidorectuctase n=1 Tax=Marasmiellus scandens TaxID=2682957 RepID=A0ABR1J6X6_9AGAR
MAFFRSLLSFATVAVSLSQFAECQVGPIADLHIVNAIVSPDGFSRSAALVEGQVTGPLLVANRGETFQLNVINELEDNTMLQSTAIHWHGFFQRGTGWADGVISHSVFVKLELKDLFSLLSSRNAPLLTMNPSFIPSIRPKTQGLTGTTLIYYCDGVRGPMVVYDPNDPHANLYDVDDASTVITLADWYHTPARAIVGVGTPSATLINGLGRQYGSNPPATDLSVINVKQGLRYRLRLVNMACDPNYVFQIDGHDFTVIEADGINHEPFTVDSIRIFAGQRYSLVLNANQPVGNYWIRALPNVASNVFTGGQNMAILRYEGATNAEPTTTQDTSVAPFQETDLHPLENPGAPGNPTPGDVETPLRLNITFSGGAFQINGARYDNPTVPVLLQILSGAQDPNNLLPAGSVYPVTPGGVVELVIPGGSAGSPHPFHLHGHAFDVIRSAGSSTYNFVNPPRRDVVSIGGAGDEVTIRFRADNPGPWFLHCHIDWHLELGLAVVFAEDAPSWNTTIDPPPAWDELCPTYNALDPSEI